MSTKSRTTWTRSTRTVCAVNDDMDTVCSRSQELRGHRLNIKKTIFWTNKANNGVSIGVNWLHAGTWCRRSHWWRGLSLHRHSWHISKSVTFSEICTLPEGAHFQKWHNFRRGTFPKVARLKNSTFPERGTFPNVAHLKNGTLPETVFPEMVRVHLLLRERVQSAHFH